MKSKTKKRLVILLAVTVLLAVGLVVVYTINQRAQAAETQKYYEAGMAAVEVQDRTAALQNLGMYIQRSGTRDAEVYFQYAKARADVEMPGLQHLTDAIKVYRQVLDLDPTREDARRELMKLYTRVRRGVEARELAAEFLKKDPKDVDALWAQAVSLQRLRQFNEALAAAEAYALAGDNAAGYFMMLDIMQQRDDKPEQIVQRAVELHAQHPDDPRFELLLGYAYTLANDRVNAEKWLGAAAARDIQDAALLRILVAQLDRLAMFDQSIAVLTRAAAGGDAAIRRDLVRRYWESDALQMLLDELESVKADAPAADAELLGYKAMALLQLSRRDEARACIDAIADVQGSAAARAWAIFLREAVEPDLDPQRLASVSREALQNDASNSVIRFSLGVAYEMLGETELAIEQWTRCKNERAGWHQPLVRMARVYTTTGRTAKAIEAAAEAAARAPDDAEVVITWIAATASGMDRLTKDEAADLLEVIEQLQSAAPGEPQTLAIKIELLARFRSKVDAVAALRAALDRRPSLDDAAVLRLAQISRQYELAMEDACFDHIQASHGTTPELALARAMAQLEAGRVDQARQTLRQAMEKGSADQQIAFRVGEARVLDAIAASNVAGHSDALAAWTSLVDAYPDHIAVQRQALASPAVQKDRALLDRTIERLKTLTGDAGITWRLARARYLLDSADREKDAAIAATLLNEVIKLAPSRVEPQLMLAEAMEKLQNPGGAIDKLIKAAELNPDSPEIALDLAEKLIRVRNDRERARTYLERVLRSTTAAVQHRRQAAAVLVQLGDVDKATQVLIAAGNNTEPDILLAGLYWRQGRFDDVRAICDKGLVQPTAAWIAFAADFYAAQGDEARAREALTRLDTAGITAVERELVLAAYSRTHGQVDDAIAHYRRAIEASPRDEAAWEGYVELLILTAPTTTIDAALREARAALPDSAGFAALMLHWPTIATFGSTIPDELRPVVATIVEEPAQRDIAGQTLALLSRAPRGGEKSDGFLTQLYTLADKHPLYWPLQSLAIQHAMAASQPEEAARIATRAAKTMPSEGEAAWLAAETLGACGRWAEALAAAQQWRRLAFRDPSEADQMIAEARIQLGESAKALTQLEPYVARATASPDDNAQLIEQVARAHVLAGQPTRAADLLRPMIAVSPAWRGVWIDLAAHILTQRPAAETWLTEVASAIPTGARDEQLRLATGWFELSQRFSEPSVRENVRQIVEPMAAADDAPAQALLLLAFCDEIDGNAAAAENRYRALLVKDGQVAIAMNNLAMLLLSQGSDADEAVELATRATQIDVANADYLHTLAKALGAKGQIDPAIDAIRRAATLDPRSIEWPLTLGELLIQAGRHDQAAATVKDLDQLITRGAAVAPAQRDRLARLRDALNPASATTTPRATQSASGL